MPWSFSARVPIAKGSGLLWRDWRPATVITDKADLLLGTCVRQKHCVFQYLLRGPPQWSLGTQDCQSSCFSCFYVANSATSSSPRRLPSPRALGEKKKRSEVKSNSHGSMVTDINKSSILGSLDNWKLEYRWDKILKYVQPSGSVNICPGTLHSQGNAESWIPNLGPNKENYRTLGSVSQVVPVH